MSMRGNSYIDEAIHVAKQSKYEPVSPEIERSFDHKHQ